MVISFATVVACRRLWRVRGYRVFTAGALRLPAPRVAAGAMFMRSDDGNGVDIPLIKRITPSGCEGRGLKTGSHGQRTGAGLVLSPQRAGG
ncbi:hypothetical protein C5967_08015 [Cronobacter sakazakii]|nr:hypothetical protein C5967_08015 [Cronobacter sakazakii]